MEKMPFQMGFDLATTLEPTAAATTPDVGGWRSGLPTLRNEVVTLRELVMSDAPSLFAMLTTPEVQRFMSPPPPDVEGFERFIAWTRGERRLGRYFCYAVVPAGYDIAIGIIQVRQLDPGFTMAEWGAALGSPFWGTGIFPAAARLVFDFVFDEIGVHRLEGRAAVQNGRANGAARKMGGVPEGVLRRGLWCRGQYHDQLMWSLLREDWHEARVDPRAVVN